MNRSSSSSQARLPESGAPQPPIRKPYRRPTITRHGKVETMVQGGSGRSVEGGNPNPAKWRP